MTAGHKHRVVRVKPDGWVLRALTKPLYWVCDPDELPRVDASRYPYGEKKRFLGGKAYTCWYLSALSILHRWTGLTLEVPEP